MTANLSACDLKALKMNSFTIQMLIAQLFIEYDSAPLHAGWKTKASCDT